MKTFNLNALGVPKMNGQDLVCVWRCFRSCFICGSCEALLNAQINHPEYYSSAGRYGGR